MISYSSNATQNEQNLHLKRFSYHTKADFGVEEDRNMVCYGSFKGNASCSQDI